MAHDVSLSPRRRALRITKVTDKTGVSKTHIYRLIKAGEFPKPCKISERVSVWDEAAIDNWLAGKFGEAQQ
jgi:prophage regulatory protein